MAAELAAGGFPAPVQLCRRGIRDGLHAGQLDAGLQIEILQQADGIQLHQVIFIQFHPAAEKAGKDFHTGKGHTFQHGRQLL